MSKSLKSPVPSILDLPRPAPLAVAVCRSVIRAKALYDASPNGEALPVRVRQAVARAVQQAGRTVRHADRTKEGLLPFIKSVAGRMPRNLPETIVKSGDLKADGNTVLAVTEWATVREGVAILASIA